MKKTEAIIFYILYKILKVKLSLEHAIMFMVNLVDDKIMISILLYGSISFKYLQLLQRHLHCVENLLQKAYNI